MARLHGSSLRHRVRACVRARARRVPFAAALASAVGCALGCANAPGASGRAAASGSMGAGSPPAPNPPAAASASSATVAPVPPASGSASGAPAGPRIYSKARHAWINYTPSLSSGWIGYLGLGDSVPLRSDKPSPGEGCAGPFHPVEPRGWVCLDERTTLDPNDSAYVALRRFAPRLDTPHPHSYGESRGARRYFSVPNEREQHRREYELAKHLEQLRALREGKYEGKKVPVTLDGVDPRPSGATAPDLLRFVPPHTYEERDYISPLSAVAWTAEFDAQGRTWVVTPDFAYMPKDKVSPYPRSTFRGVHLGEGARLPLAFFRKEPRPKYARKADGGVEPAGASWPRLAWVQLTGEEVSAGGRAYLATIEPGVLADKRDATVPRLAPRTPWGAPVQGATAEELQATPAGAQKPPEGRRTWVEISVLGGWMVAYEDTRAVFATLISPGRGGVPIRGVDPVETASTPTGVFRVDGKFWTATMVNKAWVHADVPFVLNFHGPHAIHMAYWHDRWGEQMSGGCVNLAPEDARWFFLWAEPPIPEGWHGVRSDPEAGPATSVIVHG
jgi:hypothetical protein